MASEEEFDELLIWSAAQVDAYEKREKSRAEKHYSDIMKGSALILARFTKNASFDQLLRAEKHFQKNDLAVYAKRHATLHSVQEGIDDLEDGERVYRQLIENTDAYKEHRYRKKDRASPDNTVPLDTMRRALRGQVKRVENYRANVMGNVQEQEFLSARIALLRRAEKLYDAIQRERLHDAP